MAQVLDVPQRVPEKRGMTETAITATPPRARVPVSPCVVPSLLTGALLWACHFPLSWGWLGWVALVPLLTLTRANATPRRIYWSAYLGGLAFFVTSLQWMRVADYRMYATWMMLATYCAVYFPVGLWLIRGLDRRRVPLFLSVPLVWVGLEWVRSWALSGFAWYYLGHAQHRWGALIQIADLGGVYTISLLVAAVNGWLADLAFHTPALRDRFLWRESAVAHASKVARRSSALWWQASGIAIVLVAAVLYGTWRTDQNMFQRGPRVALLQTNIPQEARNDAHKDMRKQMERQNFDLPFVACLAEPVADLIVWPETSYLWPYVDFPTGIPVERKMVDAHAAIRENFRGFATLSPTNHLIGISTYIVEENQRQTRYSSALLLDSAGVPHERFDKIHRVPFGEYVPFKEWLPFMNALAPYDHDYSITSGKHLTRFPIRHGDKERTFGALICYEDTDPYLARQYAQTMVDGKPVDFLVNQSNDGWFHGTSEHEEHLTISRFRAIENRKSLVRSVNMGISAVIDPNGRVLKPTLTERLGPDPQRRSEDPRLAHAQRLWLQNDMWGLLNKWERAHPEETINLYEVVGGADGFPDEMPTSELASLKANALVLVASVPIDTRVSLYSQWGDWLPLTCWAVVLLVFAATFLRRRPVVA